jgi:hypothetical protein
MIDHEVKEVGQASVREVRVRLDPLPQTYERLGRLQVDADQVLGRQVQVVFADLNPRAVQLRRKEDDERVAGVLLDLRPLILVADVLEGQLVKLESLLEQPKV